VDHGEITRIAGILSSDPIAVEKMEQVYHELGLPPAQLIELKRRMGRDYTGSHEFFISVLSQFKSRNGASGTVFALTGCLEKIGLVSAVGNYLYEACLISNLSD
jgi:hypothetical protein